MIDIRWPMIAPDVNNKSLRDKGEPEHATPSWNRLTCGDSQSCKMRGEPDQNKADDYGNL